ncbi:MAG: pyrrolo-quinoline quinone, partial [Hyphomicrobiaceae bacterium]
MQPHGGQLARAALLAAAALALVACSTSEDGPSLPRITDLNPFAEKEKPLPGKRISILEQEKKIGELAPALAP